ncbi:unnamed protein product [Blepharisma stoltei]|uniref:Uncharacterized protein n=1 Tax=Blepharisma stoltei TaxID=1481888 RepID=A0AAU9JP28_9CILI|nr:unnamed protein product [Blepharisma stoltei]
MRKSLSTHAFRPKLKDRSSLLMDQQETASSSYRSARNIVLNKISSRNKSTRSLINCENIKGLKNENTLFKEQSSFFHDFNTDIQPIKENHCDDSYEEEDSLIQELADILTSNEKIKLVSRKEVEFAKPPLAMTIKPFAKIKIDKNALKNCTRPRVTLGKSEGLLEKRIEIRPILRNEA